VVEYILSKPAKPGILGGLLKKRAPLWLGETGRIDGGRVRDFLERHPSPGTSAAYHLCGPGDMIVQVRDALTEAGVNQEDIKTEFFTPVASEKPSPETGQKQGAHTLVAHLRGERVEVPIHKKPVLFTLQDAGYDPPYSCTSGACATCMGKLISGKVTMDACFALTDKEIADGYILTCQSHPDGGDIEVTYDY
jgi:ring-1,2-phenylacetyl-CoA epoxidase subunit PaaE